MNSKLETALYLARQGFKLFPLKPNDKIPAIKNFSALATKDEKQLKEWFGSTRDFNIGISTDDLLVVDVDVKNPEKNGLETIEKLKSEGKILPATKQQLTTTNGRHMIYRTPAPIRNSVSKLGAGLDVRGRGGFIVGAGSVIGGRRYKIDKNEIVDAPEWLIGACEAARDTPIRAKEKAAEVDHDKARERAKRYLESLPEVSEGERNDAAYKTAAHLKDIGVEELAAVELMEESWKCEPPLETKELEHAVHSAYTYGREPQATASPEAMFGERLPEEPKKEEALNPIDEMNKEFAFILIGGKHKILMETFDSQGHFTYELLDEGSFHNYLASRMFSTGDGRTMPLSRYWMKSPRRRSYNGLAFVPERPVPPQFYNLWRGFNVKDLAPGEKVTDAMKRAVDNFQAHIFENVADMDTEHFKWVMAWLSHIVQRPWEKPKTALVLRGDKGVGKNAIFETLRPMFPDNYMVSGDRKSLVGNFNGHMERLLLYVADESFWSGDKAAEGILKSLITDDRINIEKKGKDTYTIESSHRFAILGNEKWVVPVSNDDRRYAVFDMKTGRKQDRKFFGDLTRDMADGGVRYLFHTMKNFDMTGIDVGKVPQTEGLVEQKRHSGGLVQQWWSQALHDGYIMDAHLDNRWETSIPAELLYQSFENFTRKVGRNKYLIYREEFINQIMTISPTTKRVRQDGAVQVVLPELPKARKEWEHYLGGREQWLN